MTTRLQTIELPDFGLPLARPDIPRQTYSDRCQKLIETCGTDWVAVPADREHAANLEFLSGFDPRFEEAMLLLGPRGEKFLLAGNEGIGYADILALDDCEAILAQSFSLMGQDRTQSPRLDNLLRDCGPRAGDRVSIVGWKYLEPEEQFPGQNSFFAPEVVVAALAAAVGGRAQLADGTAAMLHPVIGLRSVVDADEIARLEWGAARASAAVMRIVSGIRTGDTEFDAVARMGYAGEPFSCHLIFASGNPSTPINGLRSPSARAMSRGDGVACAIGYWGGLSCRAGVLSDGKGGSDADFLPLASGYFDALCTWYETADIGVEGGEVHEAVTSSLSKVGLRPLLNPGHLTGMDEWTNSPVRPAATDRIKSGMPFQVDVIPTPMPDGWALNCEDAAVIADAELRGLLHKRHPDVAARIAARKAFIAETLGIGLKDSVLPLSSAPLTLPPFWLSPKHVFTR